MSFGDKFAYVYFKFWLDASWRWFLGSAFAKIQLKIWGVSVGHRFLIYGKASIARAPESEITIGNDVKFVSSQQRSNACAGYSRLRLRTLTPAAKILISDNVSLNGTSITVRSTRVVIGEGSRVAPNVVITDSDFHAILPPDERGTNAGFEFDRPVVLGKNTWIGMGVHILKGVSIGDNTVIGAGSVVTSDIPENSIAAGCPARVLRYF